MAVYTDVSDEDLAAFLAVYDAGQPVSFKGIAEGVENSNFLLETTKGRFILTLYEKRVKEEDLPFFLELMDHLAGKGLPSARPVRARNGAALGRVAGRPAALIEFLEGLSLRRPTAAACGEVGRALGALHLAGIDFGPRRENALGPRGWTALVEAIGPCAEDVVPSLAPRLAAELALLTANWPKGLPVGVIHADLFPDNVFFTDGRLSGLIDFYFACTDILAYDFSIALNAWCFETTGEFNVTKARALFEGYQAVRQLTAAELNAVPVLARGAAFRFLLTRTYDWINRIPGALVRVKDPLEYLRKLDFHAAAASLKAYGLDD